MYSFRLQFIYTKKNILIIKSDLRRCGAPRLKGIVGRRDHFIRFLRVHVAHVTNESAVAWIEHF